MLESDPGGSVDAPAGDDHLMPELPVSLPDGVRCRGQGMPDYRYDPVVSLCTKELSTQTETGMSPLIQHGLSVLYSPGQVVELRAIGDRVYSGYYTDYAKLALDAAAIESYPDVKGIYTTLNEVNPALLSRCANRIKKVGHKEPQTGDTDILRRTWLPIDIDPNRPSGISSTDDEHALALQKAEKIAGFLSELGWPMPVIADSGNGAHLLYRVDLPNTQESTDLIKGCLTTLDRIFSDKDCSVDTSVANAARIWKLYGSLSRKGDNTQQRPYRRAGLVSVPDELTPVPFSDLMHLDSLSAVEKQDTSTGPVVPLSGADKAAPDLAAFLTRNGISYSEKPYQNGRLYALDECPFSTAHKDGAYAIQFDSGAIFAGCHHASCGGGTQRWAELKGRFDGPKRKVRDFDEWKRRNAKDRARGKAERDGLIPARDGSDDTTGDDKDLSPAITSQALEILHTGDPIQFMLDTFSSEHEGDLVVAKCLILSLASRSVMNSGGLHVLVTGESGKGKSHAFDTMLSHVPPQFRLDGRMSDKALFYAEDLKEGSAICLDDVSLSDQMQEVLKGVTTSFQKEFVYRTVDKDRRGIKRIIPKRCLWWVAKVEGAGDDQVWNRMLTVWVDTSDSQDRRVLARELEAATWRPTTTPVIRDEVLVCQKIWDLLDGCYVVIPYAERICFESPANRRNPGMLLDMIRSVAATFQFQRERTELDGGGYRIDATVKDFEIARELFAALDNVSGSQSNKLTKEEFLLLEVFVQVGYKEMTIREMQDIIKRPVSAIYKMLHGYWSRDRLYSGILAKCPALSFCRQSVSYDGISRRANVYELNRSVYESWITGAGCWLECDGVSDEPGLSGGDDSSSLLQDSAYLRHDECEGSDPEFNSEVAVASDSSQDPSLLQISGSLRDEIVSSRGTRENKFSAEIEKSHLSERSHASDSEDSSGFHQKQLQKVCSRELQLGAAFHPNDFHGLSGVKRGPCEICGHPWVNYSTRSGDRSGDGGEICICRRCYSRVVAKETLSVTTLPGVVRPDRMVQTGRELGRCHICNIGKAVWSDEEDGVHICQICYNRERRVQE